MTYRDDSVAEINRLTNEVNSLTIALDAEAQDSARAHSSARRSMAFAGVCLIAVVSVIMLMLIVMTYANIRAPLSANTRGAARQFCEALYEQDREEHERREQE